MPVEVIAPIIAVVAPVPVFSVRIMSIFSPVGELPDTVVPVTVPVVSEIFPPEVRSIASGVPVTVLVLL